MVAFQSEQLRTFLSVLENGTFDAAAVQLHVTPSAVSQRIKAMEQLAGQILLLRTTPVAATSAGAVVHKLARQMRQLEADAAVELGLADEVRDAVTVVVNADSLATWFIEALARVPAAARLTFEIVREDEQHSVGLLRSGEVMAAVTATADPVQGCSSVLLGAMEYRAVASAKFFESRFPQGFTPELLANAPAVQFDRGDTRQNNFFAEVAGTSFNGPQHFIPDPLQFSAAVTMGLGWGLMPEVHCAPGLASGELVELVPGHMSRIPLFWQRWKIQSVALEHLTKAVVQTAAGILSQ